MSSLRDGEICKRRSWSFAQALAGGALLFWFAAIGSSLGAEDPSFVPHPKFAIEKPEGSKGYFEVRGLDESAFEGFANWEPDGEFWWLIFGVYVDSDDARQGKASPVAGKYETIGDAIRFTPSFGIDRGVRYRLVHSPVELVMYAFLEGVTWPKWCEDWDNLQAKEEVLFLPKEPVASTTLVEHVYPTADKLPENLLKFYLHFSAPMSRGDSYNHIHLLRGSGQEVPYAFIQLDQELWDPEGRRFTLLIDPGRIKRDVKPHEEIGPSFVAGESYTFFIDKGWRDARGAELKEDFRKKFQTGPPDREGIDPRKWKITPPRANSKEPLRVSFPKSLDHALLQRVVWVVDSKDQAVKGTVQVSENETKWEFSPEAAWRAGSYKLAAEGILEDTAGNMIGRPFEIDVFDKVEDRKEVEKTYLPFEIKP